MKAKIFYLIVMLGLLLAGCKDNNNVTNGPSGPDPVITDISPNRGKSGAKVTITGMNFGITPEENTVTFNGKNAVVTGAGETELTVEVPTEAGSGAVAVTVDGQTATGPTFTWFPENTRFVDGVNGNDQQGDNTCENLVFPCRTITHTIDVAFGGDILEIADAVYTESFLIDKPLTLRGESEAGTIIQAHEQPGEATERVITIENVTEVIISDVTIRHGVANVSGFLNRVGGGVFMTDASGVFTNVTFSGNRANFGGGMYNSRSSSVLTGVTFSKNSAATTGGGLSNVFGSLTLTNVTFSENSAGSAGGGMFNSQANSSPTLVDVTFEGNKALFGGGGLFNQLSSLTLTNVTFSGNSALDINESGGGGGMYDFRGSPILTDVIFEDNTAAADGGGMRIVRGDATLSNVVFLDNRADTWGGGMFIEMSSPTLTNVLFHGNSARDGGGMSSRSGSSPVLTNVVFEGNRVSRSGGGLNNGDGSSPVVTNVVFRDNEAGQSGGGIYNTDDGSLTLTNVTLGGNTAGRGGGLANFSPVVLLNTILWGNTSPDGNEIFNGTGGSISLRYSLYGNGPDDIVEGNSFEAENSMTDDPLFVDAENGNLRLKESSPAIDTGDPDTDLSIFATDENGNPADLDGNPRVAGERIDIGAYENQEN